MASPPKPQALDNVSQASERSRSGSMAGINRVVLLAVDPSENARNAFEWFMANVHRPDDLIVLVHCPEAPKLPTFSFKSGMAPPVDEWKKALDEMNAKTQKLEEEYEGELIQKKLRYKVRGESAKKPGEGICQVAEQEKADLICMGTRGLSGVKRAFLGSVSEYVVRNANKPVLIIPSKKA